jgi:regulator of sirC expression with transglutaminase-like and TPR domain
MNDFLIELYETRLENTPEEAQSWATLGFLYNEVGNKEAAIETLRRGAETVPEFAPLATCVADNIENDREPTEGCQ